MSGGPLDSLGVGLWTLQSSTTRPGNPTAIYRRFADAAAHADALGFHSVWAAEHRLWYDGFCPQLLHAQAFAAARTSRLRLGQAMLIGPQHDPLALARNAATLQAITGGRLELGLGLGHRDAEFDALGLRRDRRGRLFEPVLDAVEGLGARAVARRDGLDDARPRRPPRRRPAAAADDARRRARAAPPGIPRRRRGRVRSASSATSGSSPTPSAPRPSASA